MIIKSMSRKSVTFGQLLRYINAPTEKGRIPVLHNLRAAVDYPQQIEAEFLENYNHIRGGRANGVVLYHEIIALSDQDRASVNEQMLNDLAREYLRRRAPNALAYAKAQFDTDSPHIHIVISGNQIESRQKLRLDRKQFETIKREMEAYQLEKYPQLRHSIVYGKQQHKTHDRPALTQGEQERIRRLKSHADKPLTQKEDARERLKTCLTEAQTEEQLMELLKAAQLAPYVRGNTPGVQDAGTGRKYRLSTLGLDHEGQTAVQRLRSKQPQQERTESRLRKIEDIKLVKVQRQWLRLGFREEIAKTLQPEPNGERTRGIIQAKQTRFDKERAQGFDNDQFPIERREREVKNSKIG